MHPLVQQILQQIQQALMQGALPPEALMQLLQGLEGLMAGGAQMGGAPGGQPPMPQGQPPMDPQQAAMMQMLG